MKPIVKLIHPVLSLALAASPLWAGEADKVFYRAFYQESALRDFASAADAYAEAVALAAQEQQTALLTDALLGHARCLTELGRYEEASRSFAEVLRHDPENPEAKAAVRAGDSHVDVDPELRARLEALVRQLDQPNERVLEELRLVGAPAIPFLADGLRSRGVLTVEHCATILAERGDAAAIDALRAALTDDAVLFPHLVAKAAASSLRPSVETLAWVSTALEHPQPEVRKAGAAALSGLRAMDGELRPEIDRLQRQAVADSEAEVRLAAWRGKWTVTRLTDFADELRKAAQSDDARLREAAYQLSRGDAAQYFFDVLLQSCSDSDPVLRREFVKDTFRAAVAGFGSVDEVRDATVDGLLSSDPELVETVAESLNRYCRAWTQDSGVVLSQALRRAIRGDIPSQAANAVIRLMDGSTCVAAVPAGELAGLLKDAVEFLGVRSTARNGSVKAIVESMRARQVEVPPSTVLSWAELGTQLDVGSYRLTLLEMCATTEGPEATERILAATEDEDTRAWAYRVLLDRGFTELSRLPRWTEDLTSNVPSVRDAALALGFASNTPASTRGLRQALQQGCESIGGRGRERLPRSDIERILEALVAREGERAVPDLKRVIAWVPGGSAERATRLLMDLRGVEGVKDLLDAKREHSEARIHSDALTPDELAALASQIPAVWIDMALASNASRLRPAGLHELLKKGLGSGSSDLQNRLCNIAGTFGGAAEVDVLEEYTRQGDVSVAATARGAIRKIGERLTAETGADLPAGERIEAWKRAQELAASTDPVQRRGAAAALGALGGASAIPLLLDLLQDDDPEVRRAAAAAMEKIGPRPTTTAPPAGDDDDSDDD